MTLLDDSLIVVHHLGCLNDAVRFGAFVTINHALDCFFTTNRRLEYSTSVTEMYVYFSHHPGLILAASQQPYRIK
jgi:hypothetical protein